VSDRARYTHENPRVPAPQAIVVSGDVVQGVPLRAPNPTETLAQQYAVAEEFLVELTRLFVDGDRSRVVIVPGNHDVDWNTARSAMSLVGVDETPTNLTEALFREDSQYRWNWRTRELYQIARADRYARRLDAFWEFFERFYQNVPGLLRVRRESDVNYYALDAGRIGVAAFSSCHGNDCFALRGMIPRDVIGRSRLELESDGRTFDVLVGVWHHNIEGPPYRTDYMDIDLVRAMTGIGFRLGLHGHQHKAQATAQNVFLPDRETMAVVSAGSLCAGAEELPTGVHRQYNVIEISDNFRKAKVHVREMTVGNQFGRSSLLPFGGKSFATLKWTPPRDLAGRIINASTERIRLLIERAEALFKNENDAAGCVLLLSPEHLTLPAYGRQLLIQSAQQAENWDVVIEITASPQSVNDLISRVEALVKTRRFEQAREDLHKSSKALQLAESTENELLALISAEERMHA
jgi:calcineurin-like phosphoesterase family protein